MNNVSTESAKHNAPSNPTIGPAPEGVPGGALAQKLGKQSLGKLIFLVALSVVLSSFTPFFMLAPTPLALAFLLFGPLKTAVVSVLFVAAVGVLIFQTGLSFVSAGVFFLSLLYGAVVFAIIKRQINPANAVLKYGIGLFGLIAGTAGIVVWSSGISIKTYLLEVVKTGIEEIKSNAEYAQLVAKGGEEIRALQDMLQDPNGIVRELLQWSPSVLFVTTVISLWISLFLILRNAAAWKMLRPYPFNIQALIDFKGPDWLLSVLIVGLALAAGGDYVAGEWLQVVGINLLYAVGVFYFFQGIGVFLALLTSLKIVGFFRSIVVVFTIFSAWKIVALVGLFDNWFNFRKFFKKNNEEGDIV
ncbi:MAG: DUF2232 domain-containing protein [Bdellovibrio sp.]|nr:DUF2232 domain-containing protein [Bdellovibrio sp.]